MARTSKPVKETLRYPSMCGKLPETVTLTGQLRASSRPIRTADGPAAQGSAAGPDGCCGQPTVQGTPLSVNELGTALLVFQVPRKPSVTLPRG